MAWKVAANSALIASQERTTRVSHAARRYMTVFSAVVDAASGRLRPLQFSFSRGQWTGAFTAHRLVCGLILPVPRVGCAINELQGRAVWIAEIRARTIDDPA